MAERRTGGRGIVIHVTEEIINTSIQRDSSHCMIADALKAELPQASSVTVDLQTIRWSDRKTGKRYIYLTPSPAQIALINFDQGVRPEEPFSLRLGKPTQIMKMNRDRNLKRVSTKSTNNLPKGVQKTSVVHNREVSIRGGDYPPTAAISNTRGRRRTFGLRSLKP